MDVSEKKLNKLKEFVELLKESLTREEFLEAFKSVLEQIEKLERDLISKIDQKTSSAISTLEELQQLHKEVIKKIQKENASSFSNMKRWAMEQVSTLFVKYQIKEKIAELDKKMSEIHDGKDADSAQIVQDVIAQIKLPEHKETIFEPEEIRDKLELLTGKERLEIKAIKDLQELLDELKKRPTHFGGGGYSKIAADMHDVPNEVVSGSGTTFTLAHIPSPATSLKLYGRGQRLLLTTKYSVSGKVITTVDTWATGDILADYNI